MRTRTAACSLSLLALFSLVGCAGGGDPTDANEDTVTGAASTAPVKSLTCQNATPAGINHFKFKVEGKVKNQTELGDLTATATDEDGSTHGTVAKLVADADYHPRRYVDMNRFDLTAMNTVDGLDSGHPYLPLDTCELQFLLPKTLGSDGTFQGRMIFSCDQQGGTAPLACTLGTP